MIHFELLDQYLAASPVLKDFINAAKNRKFNWSVPLYIAPQKIVTERALVCGDAAGLVNSITFSGLPYAIKSGEIAGKVVVECIKKQEF